MFLSTLIFCTIISKTIPMISRLFYSVSSCMNNGRKFVHRSFLFREMYTNTTMLINMNSMGLISFSFSIAGCHCVP